MIAINEKSSIFPKMAILSRLLKLYIIFWKSRENYLNIWIELIANVEGQN